MAETEVRERIVRCPGCGFHPLRESWLKPCPRCGIEVCRKCREDGPHIMPSSQDPQPVCPFPEGVPPKYRRLPPTPERNRFRKGPDDE